MRSMVRIFLVTLTVAGLATGARGEEWIDFHTEKWSRASGKLGRKLHFSNRYSYDAASIIRTGSGDLTLWIREISDNDSYYVKKGAPKNETVFRRVHVWCKLKRYEVLQADTFTEGANELLSEEITAGSYYERLHAAVCRLNAR
jgi:hypothetical protein